MTFVMQTLGPDEIECIQNPQIEYVYIVFDSWKPLCF